MKVVELLYPKKNPRRPGLHNPNSSRIKGDVIKLIKDLHGKGVEAGDILLHVKRTFGSDVLKTANECLEIITNEAMHVAPKSDEQIERLREIFTKPLPVEYAPEVISDIINDDALNDEMLAAPEGTDARPIIFKWIEMNMPTVLQKHQELMGDGNGIFSPLHGYTDPEIEPTSGQFSSFTPT
jgi:hypothetical protein